MVKGRQNPLHLGPYEFVVYENGNLPVSLIHRNFRFPKAHEFYECFNFFLNLLHDVFLLILSPLLLPLSLRLSFSAFS